MKCYEFKRIKFKKGIFDASIDATYIIHLLNNGRLSNIKKQLMKVKPTKSVFILENKGFKTCNKDLVEKKSTFDLIHCYLEIFKHSHQHQFQNILILEDDFIFDIKLNFQDNINNINNFCLKHQQDNFMLSLGTLPIITLPSLDSHFYKTFITIGTHNMIYSKKCINYILKEKEHVNVYNDWDVYLNKIGLKYIYDKPLIYQKFEETENQKNWLVFLGFKYFILYYFKILQFNKHPSHAFQNHYLLSKIITFILFLGVMCLIIILMWKRIR